MEDTTADNDLGREFHGMKPDARLKNVEPVLEDRKTSFDQISCFGLRKGFISFGSVLNLRSETLDKILKNRCRDALSL